MILSLSSMHLKTFVSPPAHASNSQPTLRMDCEETSGPARKDKDNSTGVIRTTCTTRQGTENLKLYTKFIIGIAIIGLGLLIWQGLDFHQFAYTPAGSAEAQQIVSVSPGENFTALAAKLKKNGIITHTAKFKLLAVIKGMDKKLKAGEYPLSADMTPTEVLDVLVSGKSFLYRLTIPEGYTLRQIAGEVAKNELGRSDEFVALATSSDYAANLDIKADTLEGYLFPDTYYFPKSVSEGTIIRKMVDRFNEQFPKVWRLRADELNRSVHEIVTLASIIEKETGDPSERPIIASVFHNRLKKRMRLESDPTVIYGIPNFDGNIKRIHLLTHTPYNTYKIKGLPPGPIANPGRESIRAALYPAETDFLFFVSKKDTTHHFSTNIKDHRKAVQKYQLRRRKKRTQ